jgi:peptide/histidine transporter 3/4
MAINIGSLAAVTGVVWVQENVSWAVGFAVPAAAMAAAVCVFVAGAGRYRHVPPAESPLARVWKVVRAAARARRAARPPPPRADEAGLRAPLLAPDGTSSSSALLSSSATNIKLSWLDAAAAPPRPGAPPPFSRAQVEEVKAMARVLPVFFATILYWTVYMQMGSFFVVQGAGMDRRLALPGGRAFVVPAASLSVVNTLAIVALIPLYDRLLVPALRRAGRPMTHLRRIGWGLAVAAAAMAAAAAVEARRLALFRAGAVIGPADAPPPGGDGLAYGFSASTSGFAGSAGGFAGGFSAAAAAAPQLLDPAPPSAVVAMSIWWQAPQYLLVGLSEVFASIGQMELFYDQAPAAMRSCSMALQLLSVCLGSYLSGALVYALAAGTAALDPARLGWLPKDLNAGRLDLFFWAMAALCLADLAAFLWVAASYEYKVDVVRPAVAAVAPPAAARPPPGARPPAAPLAAAAASRAHPRASPSMYGRSISVLPQTPAMPAPFR